MVGFLNRVLGSGNTLSSREEMKEAIAYFVVLMIYADGTVEDEEVRVAMGTLSRCGLFTNNTNDEDFELLQNMERKMNQDAEGNAQHYANILTRDDWKFTAAAIMADIMLADGNIDSDEIHFITHLAIKAGIGDEELEAIVATVKALRRPW